MAVSYSFLYVYPSKNSYLSIAFEYSFASSSDELLCIFSSKELIFCSKSIIGLYTFKISSSIVMFSSSNSICLRYPITGEPSLYTLNFSSPVPSVNMELSTIAFNNVDLPAPFRPIIAIFSLSFIFIFISSSIASPSNSTEPLVIL